MLVGWTTQPKNIVCAHIPALCFSVGWLMCVCMCICRVFRDKSRISESKHCYICIYICVYLLFNGCLPKLRMYVIQSYLFFLSRSPVGNLPPLSCGWCTKRQQRLESVEKSLGRARAHTQKKDATTKQIYRMWPKYISNGLHCFFFGSHFLNLSLLSTIIVTKTTTDDDNGGETKIWILFKL